MANCQKYTRAACGHLFKHYERARDENGEYIKFGNEDIDLSRTHLNYNLATAHQDGQGEFIKRRCGEVKMQKRADVNVMCSWVVTAPKEIREDETEKFFQEGYKFLSERYGKENIISAYVHMDETTPHIHFTFVPVVLCKKKNILKVSAKEAIDKTELKKFHGELSNYMEKIFGRDVGILNEATKDGNKNKEQLKQEAAQKKLEDMENKAEHFEKLAEENKKKAEAESKKISALTSKRKGMEEKFKSMEKLYNGKKLTADKIEKLKPTQGHFGIKDITIADIENLKKTAMGTARKEIALEEANEKINRIEKENADLKKRVPTFAEQLEHNQRLVKIRDLENENQRLRNIIEKIKSILIELPEQVREIVSRIINPAASRSRTRDDVDR